MSRAEARRWCEELGINSVVLKARRLPFHAEARRLCPVGIGTDGRDKFLTARTAAAWQAMQAAAASEGVPLLLISAFRSYAFQTSLIRAKLQRGMTLEAILAINAPPGCSEHHTGRAVDIGTPDCAALDEAFEHTPAFAWLSAHAARFGFSLSYPAGNAEGYLYEPWHWCRAATRNR